MPSELQLEQQGYASEAVEFIGAEEELDLGLGLLAVLEGAGEGLDELDDAGGVEAFAVVAGHTDEKRLDEREVHGQDAMLGFGIGLVFLKIGVSVARMGKGILVLEDVVDEIVFEDVRVPVHERLKVEAVGVGVGDEDVLLAGRGIAVESGFEVLNTLEEARRDGGLGESGAEELHDQLELLGRLRLDIIHQRAEALEGGDAGAIGEHVGYGGGIRFGPIGDGPGSAEGFESAGEDAQ